MRQESQRAWGEWCQRHCMALPRCTLERRELSLQQQPVCIRRASLRDLDSICRLEDISRPAGNWQRGAVAEELTRARAITLVAERQDQAVGWLAAWAVPPDECHILEVAVHPAHRRQHIASWLLLELLKRQQRAGARLFQLEVRGCGCGSEAAQC